MTKTSKFAWQALTWHGILHLFKYKTPLTCTVLMLQKSMLQNTIETNKNHTACDKLSLSGPDQCTCMGHNRLISHRPPKKTKHAQTGANLGRAACGNPTV